MGFHLLLGFSADSQPLKSWGKLQFPVHCPSSPPPWPESLGRSCWEKISLSRI